MRITDLIEQEVDPKTNFIQMMKDFLPLAMNIIGLKNLPDFKLVVKVDSPEQPTFGKFVNKENKIYLAIEDRHPIDILRTLAHELVHFHQGIEHELAGNSGETGSPQENQAHEIAGIVMRHFGKEFSEYYNDEAVDVIENFADGKNPGRKGLAKRSGVNTKASVSSLRKTAKHSSGEKARMAHWLANMKAGRAKAKRK